MTLHNRPAAPASGRRPVLRLIVPIPPRASPRACLEAQIDFLLETLDRIDGDPDLEETGDLEPSIGGNPRCDGVDLELDTSDSEPWLGSLDRALDQRRWAEANHQDLELDRSDYEDDGDREVDGPAVMS